MKHEKTFAAIAKLKDIEVELHRLKNALEIANKAPDARREWVGLTDDEIWEMPVPTRISGTLSYVRRIEARLKEKNT
jgi:hypothetical protein